MGPKRILLVSTSTGYGGAERSMEILVPELARRAKVLVLTGNSRHRRNLKLAARRAGVRLPILRLPVGETRPATAIAAAICLLVRVLWRPQAVIANTERAAVILARIAKRWPWAGRRTWLYVRDFRWRDLPGVMADLPSARILVPGPAVLVRPDYLACWVEPKVSRVVRIVPDMVAETHEGEPTLDGPVLHLATVNAWKGHGHLINAVAHLEKSGRSLPVRSLGLTELPALRRDLHAQIDAAELDGVFQLLDHAEDPTSELQACLGVVVTSIDRDSGPETFGRSVIEAWAHGRPVVAYATGGPSYLIEDGVDGLLVPEGDEAALAEALWRLRTELGLARRLGLSGREKVNRDYLAAPVADKLLAVLAGATE